MPRVILWDLQIDWGLDGSYTSETARLVSANGTVRLAAPESGITSPRGTVDQCTLTLDNSDGRYSPLNTSSPLYSALQGGNAYHAPFYLRVSIDNGSSYSRVFTGVIKIPREGPPYPGTAATVQIDGRSRDETLLNKRMSTDLATFRSLHDSGANESSIISSFLLAAGLVAADYTLDPGLFVIPWAWLDDESPVEDIWSMAAACGGRFYCDQDGEFRYESMTHWLFAPHTTSQQTYLAGDYGQMDGPAYNDQELYNGVTVVASPRDMLDSAALWAAEQTIMLPAGASRTITAKLRQPAYQIDEAQYTAVTGGGRSLAGSLAIVLTKYAQRVQIAITNSDPVYAAEIIALQLMGIAVSGGPDIEESRNSGAAFWTSYSSLRPGRIRLLRGNAYLQTAAQAGTLAEFLRDRYQTPRLTWTLRNVPGNPVRRLGDRVTLGNAAAMSSNRDAFITAITWRLSNQGFGQDLEVLDATQLYPYGNSGDTGYFVIGTNVLGSTTGAIAHIFY
jgi:hypothetical protein